MTVAHLVLPWTDVVVDEDSGKLMYSLEKNFATLDFSGMALEEGVVRMKVHGPYGPVLEKEWALSDLDGNDGPLPGGTITADDYDDEEGGGWQCTNHRGR